MAIYGNNKISNKKECLTCGQTENLGKELHWTLRVLANENLQFLEKENPGCTGRWNFIQNDYKDYEYVLVNKGEKDFEKREAIEAIYSIQNKAKYWQPSITQLNSVYFLSVPDKDLGLVGEIEAQEEKIDYWLIVYIK